MRSYDFDDRDDWFLHAARAVTQTLLANASCGSHASDLVKVFHTINKVQRAKNRTV